MCHSSQTQLKLFNVDKLLMYAEPLELYFIFIFENCKYHPLFSATIKTTVQWCWCVPLVRLRMEFTQRNGVFPHNHTRILHRKTAKPNERIKHSHSRSTVTFQATCIFDRFSNATHTANVYLVCHMCVGVGCGCERPSVSMFANSHFKNNLYFRFWSRIVFSKCII